MARAAIVTSVPSSPPGRQVRCAQRCSVLTGTSARGAGDAGQLQEDVARMPAVSPGHIACSLPAHMVASGRGEGLPCDQGTEEERARAWCTGGSAESGHCSPSAPWGEGAAGVKPGCTCWLPCVLGPRPRSLGLLVEFTSLLSWDPRPCPLVLCDLRPL